MALQELIRASSDQEVRELMEFREKAYHDEATRLFHAREEGREEGRQEGIEKGKIEAARKMLGAGMKRDEIARILDIEENKF